MPSPVASILAVRVFARQVCSVSTRARKLLSLIYNPGLPMSDASYRDAIFSTPLDRVARFSFDEKVVACFPDMIRRSVPGYGQILGMLSLIAQRHLRHGAHVYDLGCSLGASGLALAGALPPDAFRYTGVDLSPAMVAQARQTFQQECPEHAMQVEEADIRALEYAPSGMIILNFTLQFLPAADRKSVV